MELKAYDFDKIVNRKGTGSTKWDADPNLFIEDLDYKVDAKNILPLWIADMDFEVLPEIKEALIKRAEHGVFGYTEMPDACYDAIINWEARRHNFKIKREWLLFTAGAVTAAHIGVQAFCQPGDKVIIQPPVYYPFYRTVSNNGAQLLLNNLIFNENSGKYEIDFEDFERKAKDPRASLFILCSPHNPVGRVWTRGELERLAAICAANHVKIISDELHSDLIMPGFEHLPIASLSETSLNNTVTIIAPSKTFNIAGIQATVNIIPDAEMRQKFENALMRSSLMRLNLFAIEAMQAAYTHGDKWLDEIINYIKGNYDFLVKYMAEKLPKVKVMPLEGTYLAWLDFRAFKLNNYDLQKKMLVDAKLWLDEGYVFGESASGFERVALACPRSYIKEAVDRMAKAFN
ncbi:MAG: pyridoxal phosphate-dependent aminotransferase [Synergistaceae bacterium]|nr:pyridoxal phosphate-dependent aminotransferase [Synergistaceae bacterium]